MNKINILLLLLCTALWPCRAQVGPNDPGKPTPPTTNVAQIGSGTTYTSLADAFGAVNADATINLLLSWKLAEATPITVNNNITLNLASKQLECPAGLTATINQDKVLTLKSGSLTGSLIWDGAGQLFAGEDVTLSDLKVTKNGKPLYRVLVKLPNNSLTVQTPFYGEQGFTTFHQAGDILCCWLPQSSGAQTIAFKDQAGKDYVVPAVVVSTHAATTLNASETTLPSVYVAETEIGGSTKQHKTLKEAFAAFSAQGGTMKLLSNASFSETYTITQAIQLDLNSYTLTATQGAGLTTSGSGSLHTLVGGQKQGKLAGSVLVVDGNVVFDHTVRMAGVTVTTSSGQTIYRTRLILPTDATGKTLTYTYGTNTNVSIPSSFTETSDIAAYIWLASQSSPQTFTLTLTGGSSPETKTKSNVTIEANHDNVVNLEAGDMVAKVTGLAGGEESFSTFHAALEAVTKESPNALTSYTITLLANVSLSGESPHPHALKSNQLVTIDLDGHTLTGENCYLQAIVNNSAYILIDNKSKGNITGTLQIDGCIYIDESIPSSKIANVVKQGVTGTLLYRLLATVDEPTTLNDGFAKYKWDSDADVVCYIKGKKACLFLPTGGSAHTLEVTPDGGNKYSASGIIISNAHSNVTTVRLPGDVAQIGSNKYATLKAALNDASANATIELLNHASLDEVRNLSSKLTIDLKGFSLAMTGTSGWNVTSGDGLYIHSSTTPGTITGDFSVTEDVCISASVAINGTVTKGGATVYRTRFFLPSGTTAATYSYNNVPDGAIIFPGETRSQTNSQAVGYAFITPASGTQNLSVTTTGTPTATYMLKQIFIQAFHNNQFDMEAGDDLVEIEGGQKYALFSTALQEVNGKTGGGTIKLLRSQTLSGYQSVSEDVTIDLAGCTLNVTDDAAFDVTGANVLTIKDSENTPGSLYGLLHIRGALFVSPEVKIAGTVVREGEELYRTIVTNIGAYNGTSPYKVGLFNLTASIQNGTGCFWLFPTTTEQDLTITAGADTYEATLLPALPNHNTKVKAYKQVSINSDVTIASGNVSDYNDCNLLLTSNAKLTISTDQIIFHRITMEKGTEIFCEHPVLATEGIVYRYAFPEASHWYAFSQPYNVRMIRRSVNGVQSEIQPYLADGTGGHFWLKTLSTEGSFSYVPEEKIRANVGYIIAVPENLTSQKGAFIDFVSPANQFLNRLPVAWPTVQKGKFYQAAPGTLHSIEMKQPFYQLSDDGLEYTLVKPSEAQPGSPVILSPFTSIVLADAQTMALYSRLLMDRFPTAIEPVFPVTSELQVRGGKGCLTVDCPEETLLTVYTVSGQPVCLRRLPEGRTVLPLRAGLYVVNRQKVIVY